MTTDDSLDAILADALAPPTRSVDLNFAARVGAAVAEAARFRAWRRRALRQLGVDALILLGLAGSVLTAASAPEIERMLADVPLASSAAAGVVAVLWLLLAPRREGVFTA